LTDRFYRHELKNRMIVLTAVLTDVTMRLYTTRYELSLAL
jgi:hypothetical protein